MVVFLFRFFFFFSKYSSLKITSLCSASECKLQLFRLTIKPKTDVRIAYSLNSPLNSRYCCNQQEFLNASSDIKMIGIDRGFSFLKPYP